MTHHVAVLAYDRLCTFEFGCAVELFALERPELGVPWYSHAICAVEDGPLRAAGGISIHTGHGLDELARAATIVVPGWRDIGEPPPPALAEALRAAHARGARIATICSGAFVLAHAGLLDGRRATTHWRYAAALAERFPQVRVEASALYVQDENLVTSAGSAAGLDMLLHLVREDYGSAVANLVAQRLVVPAHRDGEQAQLIRRPLASEGANRIARLMDWVREHLRSDHTVDAMAAHAGMSRRTFERKFRDSAGMTPLAWLVRERVALAEHLLETRPGLAIGMVAELAGFGSPESLRRHFRRHGRPAPAALRRTRMGARTPPVA